MKRNLKLLFSGVLFIAAVVMALCAWQMHLASRNATQAHGEILTEVKVMDAEIDQLNMKSKMENSAIPPTALTQTELSMTQEKLRWYEARIGKIRKTFAEKMASDKEFQLKYFAAKRANIDVQYGPFFRIASLSNQQREALADILLQRTISYDSISVSLEAQEKDAGIKSKLRKEAKRQADDVFTAALQTTLGADVCAQFSKYELQSKAWSYVGSYASELALNQMPLNFEQAQTVVKAISEENAPYLEGRGVNMNKVNWQRVDEKLAPILTPEQLEFLRTVEVNGEGRQYAELNKAIADIKSPSKK